MTMGLPFGIGSQRLRPLIAQQAPAIAVGSIEGNFTCIKRKPGDLDCGRCLAA